MAAKFPEQESPRSELEKNFDPSSQNGESYHIVKNEEPVNGEKSIGVKSNSGESRDLSPGSAIKAFLLARWDNVLGPHWMYIWMESHSFWAVEDSPAAANSFVDYEISPSVSLSQWIKYVTTHTLEHVNGLSDAVFDDIRSSLVLVSDLSLAYFSVTFCIPEEEMEVPHSFTFLCDLSHLSALLQLRYFLYQWVKRIVPQIKILLVKSELTESQMNSWLAEVHPVLSPEKILTNPLEMPLEEVLLFPGLDLFITSHLQTFGNSVVTGSSIGDINLLVCFLMLFLNDDEQYCCQMANGSSSSPFQCGLFIQGLLQEQSGECNLPSASLTCNPYPVTVIDLHKKQGRVRQSSLYKSHRMDREKALKQELLDLWTDTHNVSASTENVLHTVKESSKLVKTLVSDLSWLPLSNWLQRIQYFKRTVSMKVLALLLILNSKRDQDIAGNHNQVPVTKKMLCSALDLSQVDFLIILAAAEKLRPGIYNQVE